MIDLKLQVDQVASKELQVHKVVIHQRQQHQLILHQLSHQINKHQVVDTTTHLRQKMISLAAHLEQQDILHNVPLLVQAFLDLKAQLVLVLLIQELKWLPVELIQALKLQFLVHLIQLLVNLKFKDQQVLPQPNDHLQSGVNLDLVDLNKAQLQVVLAQQLQVVLEQQLKAVEAVDHHHQVSKMKARKEITQQFQENLKSIIQFSPKSHQPLSIATNKNSLDIMLM